MDQYFVVGNPIAQSKSPFIHQLFAQQTAQALQYDKKLIAIDEFESSVKQLQNEQVCGLNVTAPFKEQAFALCDELSDFAAKAGAVNTLIFKDNKIIGDNTDGVGLVSDLIAHKVLLKGRRILMLGAGGAAKGVVSALLAQTPESLTIANRSVEKAQLIASQYPGDKVNALTFPELTQANYDVIINATSAGLNGQALNIPSDIFTCDVTCYDMTYARTLTPFLQYAKESGVTQLIDGLGMLVGQAAQSFYLWRGVKPDTHEVTIQLRAEMSV